MDNSAKKADILGVQINCLNLAGLVETFFAAVNSPKPSVRTFSYANTHVLNTAYLDSSFRETLNQMDVVYADGIGAVIGGRILGSCRLEKMTGADWIHPVAKEMAKAKTRIFVFAGRPGIAEKACKVLEQQYEGIDIVGTADGYFSQLSEVELIETINATSPDVLFVGRGTPTQESWIISNQSKLRVKVVWAVGALFDYFSGEEKRAPRWLLAVGQEWIWRLLMDPLAKWKRYILGNPIFLLRVIKQKFARG